MLFTEEMDGVFSAFLAFIRTYTMMVKNKVEEKHLQMFHKI